MGQTNERGSNKLDRNKGKATNSIPHFHDKVFDDRPLAQGLYELNNFNAHPETCHRLTRSQAIGEAWDFLPPQEVTRWQALNKWMYRTAVGRIQTRINVNRKKVFFVRQGVDIILEVRVLFGRYLERQQDFSTGAHAFYTV